MTRVSESVHHGQSFDSPASVNPFTSVIFEAIEGAPSESVMTAFGTALLCIRETKSGKTGEHIREKFIFATEKTEKMYVIGIAGGSGSGKTTLVDRILKKVPSDEIAILPQDAYYRDLSHLPLEKRREQNFDHPDSIEWPLMVSDIRKLKGGQPIAYPTYSYLECIRMKETVPMVPKKILLVEGILIYTCAELRKELDMKLFLEVPADRRLTRIIQRDIASRGRTVDMVIERYYQTVRPMYEEFIKPTKPYADMLIVGGGLNENAAEFIAAAISHKLKTL